MGISDFQYQQMLARTTKVRPGPAPPASRDAQREADIHDQIEDHCRSKGWYPIHSRMDRATTQRKGIADFIIIAPGGVVFFVEVKRPGGKPTPEQLQFAAICKRHGQLYALVYSYEDYLAFVEKTH